MEINITADAMNWFKDEFEFSEDKALRIFVRYGGCGSIQEGFSLGFSLEAPHHIAAITTVDGIDFFIAQEDEWYFEDKNVKVVYQKDAEEIAFVHE